MFIPHLRVPNSVFLFRADRLKMDLLEGYDVVVVQRQVTPANLAAMKTLREAGKKIVYDLDDNMWSLPASNPAQKIFKQLEEGFGICANEANILTVSTQGLRVAVRSALPNLKCEILVTPNAIDFDLFHPTQVNRNDGRILLGYAGSNTHDGDVREAWDVLPELVTKFPNLHLEFVGGTKPPKRLQGHDRVKFKSWVPVCEFPNRFSNWCWDITMAPLDDNRFNRSKSCIKALESAAMRIPCLMSDVQPYAEFCALGGDELKWLLCRFESDWKKKLERLIQDPLYRNYMGDLMYKTAKKYFDIEARKDNWIYAISEAAKAN